MTELTGYVTQILTQCGSLITSLFATGEGAPPVLTAVAALPIVSGIIAVVVSATRKAKG